MDLQIPKTRFEMAELAVVIAEELWECRTDTDGPDLSEGQAWVHRYPHNTEDPGYVAVEPYGEEGFHDFIPACDRNQIAMVEERIRESDPALFFKYLLALEEFCEESESPAWAGKRSAIYAPPIVRTAVLAEAIRNRRRQWD